MAVQGFPVRLFNEDGARMLAELPSPEVLQQEIIEHLEAAKAIHLRAGQVIARCTRWRIWRTPSAAMTTTIGMAIPVTISGLTGAPAALTALAA
jgi:hypothetical protein